MPKSPDPSKNGGRKPGPRAEHNKGRFRICDTCGGSGINPKTGNSPCIGCGGKGGTAVGNI